MPDSVDQMTEAYDTKALLGAFPDLAEETVVRVIRHGIKWADKSALLSKTPFDDIARVVYPQLEKELVKLADKIDGQADQPVQAVAPA